VAIVLLVQDAFCGIELSAQYGLASVEFAGFAWSAYCDEQGFVKQVKNFDDYVKVVWADFAPFEGDGDLLTLTFSIEEGESIEESDFSVTDVIVSDCVGNKILDYELELSVVVN